MEKAIDFIKDFDEYVFLWTTDRVIFLEHFLLYGRRLTPEEVEIQKDETNPRRLKESPPTIEQFQEKIIFYENLYHKVEAMPGEKILYEWLKIDVRPFRQVILNNICKWSLVFKNHLYNKVINTLEELDTFITTSIAGMLVCIYSNFLFLWIDI